MKPFPDEDLARMRKAISQEELQRAPEGCPSKEELWGSAAGELDPVENEKIILHLARCSECVSIWQLAREMLLPDEASASSVISLRDRRQTKVWRRVLLPAVAATMLIGVGLSAAWLLRRDASSPPVFRRQHEAGGILAAPSTRVLPRTACRLEWSAGPDGTRYDLIATDGRLEILGAAKGLTKPEYDLPPEEIPTSTQEVFWRVTAHLPDGRTISSETFTTLVDDATSEQE